MNTKFNLLMLVALGTAGCASAELPLPASLAGLILIPTSSAMVVVREPVIRMDDGLPTLFGHVGKVFGPGSTENTHLDIVYLNAKDEQLRQETVTFSPRKLSTTRRSPARQGFYRVPLSAMPAGTLRIDVRAHDGPHESPLPAPRPNPVDRRPL